MSFIHWVVFDPSAGWIRTGVMCYCALTLTNVVMRKFGWDQDRDVDEENEDA